MCAKDKPGETFTEAEGISRVKDYKYLGLTVTHGKKKVLKMAKDTVERRKLNSWALLLMAVSLS